MTVQRFALPSLLCTLSILPTLAAVEPPQKPVGEAINDFTFRLIKQTGTPADKNFLLSPFSVSEAMGMLLPGLKPSDQQLLGNTITPGIQASQVTKQLSHLASTMSHNPATLSIANSAWVDSRMKLNSGYQKSIQSDFGAGLFTFEHNQASVNKINHWVDAKTRNRIPTIIDKIKGSDRLILIDAVAFDGQWAKQFDVTQTAPQDFYPLNGPAVKKPMMHSKEQVGYFKNANLRAIQVKYKGDVFSVLLMLPERSKDAGKLLAQMDARKLNQVLAGLNDSDDVKIAVPKFEFSDSHQLAGPLKEMGLEKFFGEADFSKIASGLMRAKIDRVIHKTFIQVDEKGTKAAAATGVTVQPTMVRVDKPEFIADRPFAFLIVHNASHAILFAGVVNKP